MKHYIRGFTLIELLVVISIIGMLSSVLLASVNTARAKGRDAARVQALSQVRNALELYYSDHKAYPDSSSYPTIESLVQNGGPLNTYIKSVPSSLSSVADSQYTGDTDSYQLFFTSETGGAFAKNVGCTTADFTDYNALSGVDGKGYCIGNGSSTSGSNSVTADVFVVSKETVGWTSTGATSCDLVFNPSDPYVGHETTATQGSITPSWVDGDTDYLADGVTVYLTCSDDQGNSASDSQFFQR